MVDQDLIIKTFVGYIESAKHPYLDILHEIFEIFRNKIKNFKHLNPPYYTVKITPIDYRRIREKYYDDMQAEYLTTPTQVRRVYQAFREILKIKDLADDTSHPSIQFTEDDLRNWDEWLMDVHYSNMTIY
jgi:hypothetical protein